MFSRKLLFVLGSLFLTSALYAATCTVTSLIDTPAVVATPGTLRDCINTVNNSGTNDEIVFSGGGIGTIELLDGLPPINKPGLTLNINDAGAAVSINGQSLHRIFTVRAGTVEINDMTLLNGRAEGGSTGNGAGGGMGAGAALFVNDGADVTVDNVVFTNNQAIGGDGSFVSTTIGGGGGGMGGNGGFNLSGNNNACGGGGGFFSSGGDSNSPNNGCGGGGGLYGDGGNSGGTARGGGGGGGSLFPGGTSNGTDTAGGGGGGSISAGISASGAVAGAGGAGGGGNGGDAGLAGSPGTAGGGGGGGGGTNGGTFTAGGAGGDGGGGGGASSNGSAVSGLGPALGGDGGFFGGGGGGRGAGGDGGFGGGGGGSTQHTGAFVATGGNGGFGGGGGSAEAGGDGGFGGGGGSGTVSGGSGGFGAGAGNAVAGSHQGGGGLGAGGAIFVRQGGTLTVLRSSNIASSNSVTAGPGFVNGSAIGGGLFLMNGVNPIFNVAASENTIFAGDIGGDGTETGITKQGDGTLTLGGTNTFVGTVALTGGTTQISAANNLGSSTDITMNAATLETTGALALSQNIQLSGTGGTLNTGAATTANGLISGAANFTKSGASSLALSSANTYTGDTTLDAGTLQSGINNALPSTTNLTLNNSAVFDVNGNSQTIVDLISASATTSITLGAGSLTAGGSNTTTFAGAISGTGTFTKEGSGSLNFTGTNTYTGDTNINAGRLAVNGSIAGDLFANSSSTLGGSGTIAGSVLAQSGSIVAPGNSIGTITIGTNHTQASGSTLQIEIDGSGASDLLDVSGTTTIQSGVTLEVIPLAGPMFSDGQTFIFIESDGAITGTFDTITPATIMCFSYTPTIVAGAPNTYQFTLQAMPFADVVVGGNPGATAAFFDTLVAPGGSDLEDVLLNLQNTPGDQIRAVFNSLNRANFADLAILSHDKAFEFHQSIGNHLFTVRDYHERKPDCGFWIEPLGHFKTRNTYGDTEGYDSKAFGLSGGFDCCHFQHMCLGLGAEYRYTRTKWDTNGDTADMHSICVAAYASAFGEISQLAQNMTFFLEGCLSGNFHDYETLRRISFVNINRKAKSDHDSYGISGTLKGGTTMHAGQLGIEFSASSGLSYLSEDGHTETGADSLNYTTQQRDTIFMKNTAGVRLFYEFIYNNGDLKWIPEVRGGWVNNVPLRNRSVQKILVASGTGFSVNPYDETANMGSAGSSLSMVYKDMLYITGHYNAEFDQEVINHDLGFRAGLRF